MKKTLCTIIIALVSLSITACNESSASIDVQNSSAINTIPEQTPYAIATTFIPYNDVQITHEILTPEKPSRKIALTFDDGPSTYTDSILDLLYLYDGRSTFFVSPHRMLERPNTVQRAFDMGNEIANHSWSHRDFRALTDDEIASEIQSASEAIVSVVGVSPPLFRPPFGMSDERVVEISADLGYAIVKWTLDPIDWRYRDADIIYNTIMNEVEPGAIILVHDTRPTTAEAMRRVISSLVAEGFELITVSELLYYLYGGIEYGKIYGTYTILD